ncbi:MAG: hypothetical protein LBH59_04635 [Planctomycetaceae bacterium]|jgi:hypothetical protein|nr:hypothetical protein [Planctomycetaceae bacterium]
MIILYPGYNFQSLVTDLTEIEANEILSAYTALFHPAILKHFNKLPQWESAANITLDNTEELIVVPICCEQFLSSDFPNSESSNNVTIIRHLNSRNKIANEIIKQLNISHNFCNEFIADFYTIGTAALFVNLLSHHLHYMDSSQDSAIIQALHDIIDNFNNNYSNSDQADKTNENLPKIYLSESDTNKSVIENLFRDAFEKICEMKECYYPVSSYLLDLILVVRSTLGEPFRRLLLRSEGVNIFLSSLLLDSLPDVDAESFEALKSATAAGKIDFVVDDISEIPLLLFPILDAADKIVQAVSIYRKRLGISPTIYGRHRAGFAPFLPQILRLAGFKGVLYFTPLDGWHLTQRNQSKMIWRGVDGTKIDALIRYPMKCLSQKEFFDFSDNYAELINSDSVPTAVFASFPVDKTKKIDGAKSIDSNLDSGETNFCNDNLDDNISDELDWHNDLLRASNYTTQLGEFAKLESYFATTEQTGSEELIAVENYIIGEPSDIPFWLKVYRDNLTRTVSSAFGTVAQLLDQKLSGKFSDSDSDSNCVSDSVLSFASAAGLCRADDTNQNQPRGIAIFNAWNFGRRVFIDVSDWSGLPAVVSPIVFAGETAGKKEIVVDVPPLGYVVIPAPKNNSLTTKKIEHDSQENQHDGKLVSSKSNWNIFTKLFSKKSEPLLIFESEDKKAFILQNEFFVARIDLDTGMLRSLLTGNYRYNRLSQQLGFRLPKALRELDSRSAGDPNRGYASSVVDEIFIDELGAVTGRVKIRGRLVCDDGLVAAKFTELITVRRFSRILEFNFSIEALVEPSGDSAWDSYYAIRSAWHDNSLELRGSLGDGVYSVTNNRVLSPRFIDLRTERRAITFFTEGLPFHRKFGDRYLDTILIAKDDNKYDADGNKIDKIDVIDSSASLQEGEDKLGENPSCTIRKFRYGVGIDIRHPTASSFEFMLAKDELVLPVCCGGELVSRWLFRVDAANIIAVYWELVFDGEDNSDNNTDNNTDKKEPIGFKIYLLETEGIPTTTVLRSFKPIVHCYKTNFLNEELQQINKNEAGIPITLNQFELLPLVCLFRNKK